MDFLKIAVDLVIGFAALFIMTKILGKTQITQITTFDFISALVLGELVGNTIYDNETGLTEILFAVTIWGLLIYLLEIVTQKFNRLRGPLEGSPTIIIHEGKIIREQLKKSKLDMNQLQHLVRSKGVFSLREVEFAILETDGTISVLKKSTYENPTKKDLMVNQEKVYLPITFISDGNVIKDNLLEAGFNETWLTERLKEKNILHTKDVLYAEWLEGDGLHVQSL
ncbi:DUF421 domain-containing protein [Metabacillus fastidiosus]|uniref:DUF421 domain-containing protein n=1 Tax=Metabacillus fastidiosus TaxID=1458 RepID=UPI003D28002C